MLLGWPGKLGGYRCLGVFSKDVLVPLGKGIFSVESVGLEMYDGGREPSEEDGREM
jgi:hypothetical protein